MAEIKSTLDLVLERTKNLTMTEEEKKALHRRELEGTLQGLVHKFLDGLLNIKTLKSEIEKAAPGFDGASREILKGLLLEHLDPEGDNQKVFQAIQEVLGLKKAPYAAAFADVQEHLAGETSRLLEAMRERLADREISGSAVTPNLSRNEDWALFRQQALASFHKRIALIQDN